jgi:hypothetical protein
MELLKDQQMKGAITRLSQGQAPLTQTKCAKNNSCGPRLVTGDPIGAGSVHASMFETADLLKISDQSWARGNPGHLSLRLIR